MRIVAGDFKGRRLNMPEGYDIRPTSEKVKEAIFSIIQENIPGSVCLDLFSGTGNLGLEALSRGASFCYFGDNSRDSIALTKSNIEMCRAGDISRVIPGSFEKVLENISKTGKKLDVVFLDPPYKDGLYERCFEILSDNELVNDYGVIVAEHGRENPLSDSLFGFKMVKERYYGTIAVAIFAKDEKQD